MIACAKSCVVDLGLLNLAKTGIAFNKFKANLKKKKCFGELNKIKYCIYLNSLFLKENDREERNQKKMTQMFGRV